MNRKTLKETWKYIQTRYNITTLTDLIRLIDIAYDTIDKQSNVYHCEFCKTLLIPEYPPDDKTIDAHIIYKTNLYHITREKSIPCIVCGDCIEKIKNEPMYSLNKSTNSESEYDVDVTNETDADNVEDSSSSSSSTENITITNEQSEYDIENEEEYNNERLVLKTQYMMDNTLLIKKFINKFNRVYRLYSNRTELLLRKSAKMFRK